MVEQEEKEEEGGWAPRRLPPSLPLSPLSVLGVIFPRSRLSLHAQCHILIPHSSKLIRDNVRLMETPPPPPNHSLPPLCSIPSCLFCHSLHTAEEQKHHKGHPNVLCDSYRSSDRRSSWLALPEVPVGKAGGAEQPVPGSRSPGRSRLTITPVVNKLETVERERGSKRGRGLSKRRLGKC